MLGLEPNTPLEQCAIAAFGKEAQLMIMYKGLMDLARRSGEVLNFSPSVVYEADEFDYSLGTDEWLKHKPTKDASLRTDDKIIGAYSIAKLKNGEKSFRYMDAADIEKLRAHSKQKNGSFWTNHKAAMYIKSVTRQHCKYLPRTPELMRAIAIEDARDEGKQAQWDALDLPDGAVEVIRSAESESNQ